MSLLYINRVMTPSFISTISKMPTRFKTLDSIKKRKVCDETGKVIGVISRRGDVTTAREKGIGKIQKVGSYKSLKVML